MLRRDIVVAKLSGVVGRGGMNERERFDDFYRAAWPGAVRLAYLLTGVPSVAEDMAQDAFGRVHRQWEHVEHPSAYLRTSVVNGCHSWHRSRRSEEARLRRALPVDTAVAPERVDVVVLRDAVESLPYRQRAVVVLRYYEDLPEAEIARMLGCRPGTVKSLASRALRQLKTVVEQ
jgi:RNA polymerase sigma-70 factor (sigma-E family)